jgi:hypothetical protein
LVRINLQVIDFFEAKMEDYLSERKNKKIDELLETQGNELDLGILFGN